MKRFFRFFNYSFCMYNSLTDLTNDNKTTNNRLKNQPLLKNGYWLACGARATFGWFVLLRPTCRVGKTKKAKRYREAEIDSFSFKFNRLKRIEPPRRVEWAEVPTNWQKSKRKPCRRSRQGWKEKRRYRVIQSRYRPLEDFFDAFHVVCRRWTNHVEVRSETIDPDRCFGVSRCISVGLTIPKMRIALSNKPCKRCNSQFQCLFSG